MSLCLSGLTPVVKYLHTQEGWHGPVALVGYRFQWDCTPPFGRCKIPDCRAVCRTGFDGTYDRGVDAIMKSRIRFFSLLVIAAAIGPLTPGGIADAE